MSALPRFFFLTALAGLALWLTAAPYPFPLLATFIMAASALGFVLSMAYVHEFMPWQWRTKMAAGRRVWRSLTRTGGHHRPRHA